MTPARWTCLVLACATIALATHSARADGNPAAGKAVFRKCGACHAVQPGRHRVGPSLAGVVGRTAGTVEGFNYSDAMKAFGAGGGVWDEANLDAYLAKPKEFIKGNKMVFPGLKTEQERADVIAYLKSTHPD